jgi:integral membrane protein
MPSLSTPIGRFRIAAIAEACSWAGLLIGMFFKYVVVFNPIGVQIMGPIHGLLFVLYVLSVVEVVMHLRAGNKALLLGLIAAVPPFTTLWFDRWLLNKHAA